MANERENQLIEDVERAQSELRVTIEESKRLAERSDLLIAKVRYGLTNDSVGPFKSDTV